MKNASLNLVLDYTTVHFDVFSALMKHWITGNT